MNDKPQEPAPEAAPAAPPGRALDQAQAEMESLKDRHLRLQADFDNFRKRTQRERLEIQVRATEDLLRELLPALDHFEIGLRAAGEHVVDRAVCDGFQLVYDELVRVLARCGVTPLDAEAGGPFDPLIHEALSHAPSDQHPPDTIMQQTRRGYRLGERLLRPAQVVVSCGPGPAPGAGIAPPASGQGETGHGQG
jgi:molecular chaperone GrpE